MQYGSTLKNNMEDNAMKFVLKIVKFFEVKEWVDTVKVFKAIDKVLDAVFGGKKK